MNLKLTNITSSKIVCGLQIKGGVCHFYQRSLCLCFPNASWSPKKNHIFTVLLINS